MINHYSLLSSSSLSRPFVNNTNLIVQDIEPFVAPKVFNHFIKKLTLNSAIDYENICKMKQSNLDLVQQRTLDRLIQIRNIKINKNQTIISKVTKQCPHCHKNVTELADTTYLICGYESNGYDQHGCRNDWCFQCEKKLCKNWHEYQLFNKSNRIHDSFCCKHHAMKHKQNYYEDYCMCNNENVRR